MVSTVVLVSGLYSLEMFLIMVFTLLDWCTRLGPMQIFQVWVSTTLVLFSVFWSLKMFQVMVGYKL